MENDESVGAPSAVSTINETDNCEETNPYAYLNREEFSSEKFKIEIKNLPKFYGINEFKKLVNEKLKLGSNKVKIPRRNSPYIFVCFRSEEDRENAIKIINKFKWKGKELSAYKAKPAPDPLVKKRRDDQACENAPKKFKTDEQTQEERLKASVIPLWNVPYEEQLQQKQESIRQVLLKLGNNLFHQNSSLRDWIKKQKECNNGLICEMHNVRHSNTIIGYRNKCEFTIGIDQETSLPTVGFRIGSYATGVTGVAPLDNLNHIPESMKKSAKVFQEFVRSSKLKVFNPELQTGNFRQLTVRCAADHLMLVVGIHPQDLSEEEIEKFKKDLVDFFSVGPGKELKITSLYYEAIVKK
ncbi:tRNA (uracil-5-)-methyltransferase homolog A [Agrilus planipennis]|uniref:tRNA (Uracil-5-)-methyltransferase homolog A n=1 Tax=Agrilus planipennis TaxID=224129 RepID=A0A7F5R8N3_AGRPL|nr:tRNA (uracil-5-)-methyltransferase homolog A [Agrilus planipennis]